MGRWLALGALLVAEFGSTDRYDIAVFQVLIGDSGVVDVHAILATPVDNTGNAVFSNNQCMTPADELRLELDIVIFSTANSQSIFKQWKLQLLTINYANKKSSGPVFFYVGTVVVSVRHSTVNFVNDVFNFTD